jgi:hypothetical protein
MIMDGQLLPVGRHRAGPLVQVVVLLERELVESISNQIYFFIPVSKLGKATDPHMAAR